jgi:L,D-transpeptidase YcbB
MEVYSTFIVQAKNSIVVFVATFVIFLVSNCTKKDTTEASFEESMYSTQNFSDLVLDSTLIATFYKTNDASDSIKAQVNQFYKRRDFQFAWFNKDGRTDAMTAFYNKFQNYSNDFADSSLYDGCLDTLLANIETDEEVFLSDARRVQALELSLTTAFFRYSQKVYGGTTKNALELSWFIPRKKKNYQALLDTLVSLADLSKLQEPVNQYYISLKAKLRQYRAIQKKGGFGPEIEATKQLSVGNSDSTILAVKQHLVLTNDLKKNDNSIVFTDSLATAVTNFQRRMGLVENGKIDKQTIKELNQPVAYRIKQMMLNMERLRWVPVDVEKDYLLINIPEFKIHVFENSRPLWEANVVVGKTANRTSIFKGNISQVIFNPYWGIPTSIVKKEILPKIKNNPNFLANNNIEVINGNYRQLPGKNNALGRMKFMFPNNFHIYLHDTPSKGLFASSKRTFSHGCIRVENPKKLALFLLQKNTDWNSSKIDDVLTTTTETFVRINPTVPVYIAYFTAWVDYRGQLNFRNDVYGLDNKLSKEIFGE